MNTNKLAFSIWFIHRGISFHTEMINVEILDRAFQYLKLNTKLTNVVVTWFSVEIVSLKIEYHVPVVKEQLCSILQREIAFVQYHYSFASLHYNQQHVHCYHSKVTQHGTILCSQHENVTETIEMYHECKENGQHTPAAKIILSLTVKCIRLTCRKVSWW
jgi:hypothetical protein